MTVTEANEGVLWSAQGEIDSWKSAQHQINAITQRYRDHEAHRHTRLVWRGVRDHRWAVESSLFRLLKEELGHRPSEDEMNDAEYELNQRAHLDWRFDDLRGLELVAQIQHFGGPTRLIDVTKNPLIALWFACEEPVSNETRGPGRLLTFATPPEADLRLTKDWNTRDLRWHDLASDGKREAARWGTGTGRRYWRPPVYHQRISAQSAGFLVDGVPLRAAGGDAGSAGSIALWIEDPKDAGSPSASGVFTWRVAEDAKREIRHELEDRYAIRTSTVYPDMFGLARYFAERPAELRKRYKGMGRPVPKTDVN